MKVVDFLKRFEELEYDNDTELDILLLTDNYFTAKFVRIEDIENNVDSAGLNRIGIVVSDND